MDTTPAPGRRSCAIDATSESGSSGAGARHRDHVSLLADADRFLDPNEPAAVTCIAVDAGAADPEWDYPVGTITARKCRAGCALLPKSVHAALVRAGYGRVLSMLLREQAGSKSERRRRQIIHGGASAFRDIPRGRVTGE